MGMGALGPRKKDKPLFGRTPPPSSKKIRNDLEIATISNQMRASRTTDLFKKTALLEQRRDISPRDLKKARLCLPQRPGRNALGETLLDLHHAAVQLVVLGSDCGGGLVGAREGHEPESSRSGIFCGSHSRRSFFFVPLPSASPSPSTIGGIGQLIKTPGVCSTPPGRSPGPGSGKVTKQPSHVRANKQEGERLGGPTT